MSKAEEIVLLAEAHGFEFITFRGEARVWGAWKTPHVAALVFCAQAEVSSWLIDTRSQMRTSWRHPLALQAR